MNYQELMDVLRKREASFANMQPTSLQAPTLDQIISGIQSQYQPSQFQDFAQVQPQNVQPSSYGLNGNTFNLNQVNLPDLVYGLQSTNPSFGGGASRYASGPKSFTQENITPVAQPSTPRFVPGAFDLAAFTAKPSVSEVIETISSDSSGGSGNGNTGSTGGLSVDDAGLATGSNISSGVVGALATGAGMLTGLPLGLISSIVGRNDIAKALTDASYNSAVAQNIAMVASQMGLDAKDPANSAAISSAIDSLSSAPTGTTAATPGLSGTGGSAAAAAQSAAANAIASGQTPEQAGIASQAAADAVMSGASQTQAEAIGAVAASQAGIAQGGQGTTPAMQGGFGSGAVSQAEQTGMTTNSQGQTVSNNESTAAQDAANFGPSPSSDSSSGSSKIVCTAMNDAYGFGSFRNKIWLKYSAENLTKAHEVGYHFLFLPLVQLAYEKNVKPLRAILENIARHRSADLRAEMRGTKRDNIGRTYRAILEPVCYFVGKLKGY